MHTLTEIKVLRDEFEKAVDGYRTTVLMNKELPLEERWNAYLEIEKFLPNNSYGEGYIEKLGWECVYIGFGIDRYQTRSFSCIYECIQDNLEDMKEYPEDDKYFDQYRKLTPEQLDAWREAVLESGYGSFTNDW